MKKTNENSLHIQFDAVSTRHLRTQVTNRLIEAQQKSLLQDNFKTAASKKNDNQVACMFLNMLFFGAVFHGLEHMLGLDGADSLVPEGTLSAMAEITAQLRDDKEEGSFRNKVEGYPEGRRKDPIAASRTRKQFNLVSNNDNQKFDEDTAAEIQALAEMLDLIDVLERQGVEEMKVAKGETVQAALRQGMRQANFFSKLAA